MVIPITISRGIRVELRELILILAALAVNLEAPWIIISLDNAIPCPNRFIAIAADSFGSPTFFATGIKTAPINATAGEGQKNQEIIIIVIPITQ